MLGLRLPSCLWLLNTAFPRGPQSQHSNWLPPSLIPLNSLPQGHLRSETGQVQVSGEAETQASVVGILLLVLQSC